jgi:hypothetical protein
MLKDAALGTGSAFPGTGCGVTTWTDLKNVTYNGTISNCSAGSGWIGDGTSTPYALSFPSVAQFTNGTYVSGTYGGNNSGDITVLIYVNAGNNANGGNVNARLFDMSDSSGNNFSIIHDSIAGNVVIKDTVYDTSLSATQFNAYTVGSYVQMAALSSGGADEYFQNGAIQVGSAYSSAGASGVNSTFFIGVRGDLNSTTFFNGDIGVLKVFNRALTIAEIQQDCAYYATRFGLTCVMGEGAFTSPATPSVTQRNGSNQAAIAVAGFSNGAGNKAQVDFVPRPGFAGTDTGWVNVTGYPYFSGTVTVSAGYYNLQGRVLNSSNTVLYQLPTWAQVGVGDIFLWAGQSIAANFLGCTATAHDGVFQEHYNVPNSWISGSDPQRDASLGTAPNQGSLIPGFSNAMLAHTGYPVGIIDVAVGGSSADQWGPPAPGTYYTALIKPALQMLGAGGLRAVIWDQGEADSLAGTSQSSYVASVGAMVSTSQTDSGGTVPWLFADTATYINGSFPAGAATIQSAQQFLVANAVNGYQGANTDSDTSDRYDGTHFNLAGCLVIVPLWDAAVWAALGI